MSKFIDVPNIASKLELNHDSIFSQMSRLAREYDAINLGQGFPNFDVAPGLLDMVSSFLRQAKNQYAPMPGVPELRQALASKYERSYGRSLDADQEITIIAGATQALFNAITAIVHPGDEVIIIEPAYDSYKPVIELTGATVVPYALTAPDYRINWQEFAQLISSKTRMVIINNPHNPIGTVLKKEDLIALDTLLKDTDIIVLSDEVYEHLVFDGIPHESVIKYPGLYERALVVFSFGKTFHATGWKIGYCIASPALTRLFRSVHQWNVFSVNSFLQYALAEYLKDPEHYEMLGSFYQAKRDLFAGAMQGSAFRALSCEGSYFQLYDYSAISDLPDTEFAEYLVREHGIAGIPVSVFYTLAPESRTIRFCFAKTDTLLRKAAERLQTIKH